MKKLVKYLFLWVEDSFKVFKKRKFISVSKFYDRKYVDRIYKFNCTNGWKCEINELFKYINFNKCEFILDYGCNTAELYEKLKTIDKKLHYVGVDVNEHAITKAKMKESGNPKFSVMKVKSGQWPNLEQKIDIAIFSHSLGHIENPKYILSCLYKDVSKGSVVAIITPNLYFKITKVISNLINGYNSDRTVLCYYHKSSLKKLIQESGFKIKRMWYYGELGGSFFGLQMNLFRSRIFLIAEKKG